MRTLRIICGIVALGYGFLRLLDRDLLAFGEFGALGWWLLLDPKRPGTAKLRAKLMWVVLVCIILRMSL